MCIFNSVGEICSKHDTLEACVGKQLNSKLRRKDGSGSEDMGRI